MLPISICPVPEKGKCKHDLVYHCLAEALASGQWYPGERLPVEQALSESFHCSRVTLRTALARLERQGLIVRRQGAGTYVAERPKRLRRCLLGLVERQSVPPQGNADFIHRHIQYFLESASSHLVMTSVLLIRSDEDFFVAVERLHVEIDDYDGFIFAFPLQASELAELERRSVRFVSLTQPTVESSAVSYVDIDNYQGMYMGTCHLLELGYRHPILINGPENLPYNRAKTRGFVKALERHGIPFLPAMHRTVPTHDEVLASQCMRRILAMRTCSLDSLLVYGDWAAFGVIRELQREGYGIPGDMAVVAYETPEWVSRCTGCAITTIDQPLEEQLSQAVQLLLMIIDGKAPPCTVRVLQPSLHIRESSGCYLQRAQEVFSKGSGSN